MNTYATLSKRIDEQRKAAQLELEAVYRDGFKAGYQQAEQDGKNPASFGHVSDEQQGIYDALNEAYDEGYEDGAYDGFNHPEFAQAVLNEMAADAAQDAAEAHYDDEMWDFDPCGYTPETDVFDIEAWHADGK